jgi:antitoxin YefM
MLSTDWYEKSYESAKVWVTTKGAKMAISASTAREKLFPLIEQVNQDLKPVLITSKNGNAVLISESEYESIIETNYLLSTPANRESLEKSFAQARAGKLTEYVFDLSGTLVPVKTKKAAKSASRVKAKS